MLSGACVGTNDIKKAKFFYDAILQTLEMTCHVNLEHELGYGSIGGEPNFFVLKPYNEKQASVGNGTQVMFQAEDQTAIHAFYNAALKMGGSDEGAPGLRDYAPNYYGAYVRDIDGNKLHVSIRL